MKNKSQQMGTYGSLDFMLGKALNEEEFRLLIRAYLPTCKGLTTYYENLIEAMSKEEFSVATLIPTYPREVLLLAVTLMENYSRHKVTSEQFARKNERAK